MGCVPVLQPFYLLQLQAGERPTVVELGLAYFLHLWWIVRYFFVGFDGKKTQSIDALSVSYL